MRVNAFLTFFSQFFMSDFSGHFEARFLYYTYIYFYGNIFCKKIVYARVYIIKGKEKSMTNMRLFFMINISY